MFVSSADTQKHLNQLIQSFAGRQPKLLVLASSYYWDIAQSLINGVQQVASAVGAQTTVQYVPGSYELSAGLAFAAAKGGFDAYVVLGCLIKGGTNHYELICTAVTDSIMQQSVAQKLAVGFGLLTCYSVAEAEERADKNRYNYGGGAARAALHMLALRDGFLA
jgi:6,7-dimethyl-8-ribityllumazine synthase